MAGRRPDAVVDFQIAGLFPDVSEKVSAEETSAYLLSDQEALKLTGMMINETGDLLNQD